MSANTDRIFELVNRLVGTTIPALESRIMQRIERLERTNVGRSRVIKFSGLGPPDVNNPSQLATYQSRANGVRWWIDDKGGWHSTG